MKKQISAAFAVIVAFGCGAVLAADPYVSWQADSGGKGDTYTRPRISSNGKYVAAAKGSGDMELRLFASNNPKILWEYKDGTAINNDLAVSHSGEYIAGVGSKLVLFKNNSAVPVWSYESDDIGTFHSVCMSADAEVIVAAGSATDKGGRVSVVTKDRPAEIKKWVTGSPVYKTAISRDGRYIAAATEGDIYLFEFEKDHPIARYDISGRDKKPDKIVSLAMSGEGAYCMAASYKGNAYMFDVAKKDAPLWSVLASKASPDANVAVSGDGRSAVLAVNGKYKFFNSQSPEPLWDLNWGGYFAHTAISDDGKFIGIADSRAHKIYFFDRDCRFTFPVIGGRKPFKVYSGKFPQDLSMTASADAFVYRDTDIFYKQLPPGLLCKLDTNLPIYKKGDEMKVQVHISNPGKACTLKQQLEITLLPQDAMIEDMRSYGGESQALASKLRVSSKWRPGVALLYDETVSLETHSSKEMVIAKPIPSMVIPEEVRKWLNNILGFLSDIQGFLDTIGDFVEKYLPEELTEEIKTQFIDPAREQLKEIKEEADNAVTGGASQRGAGTKGYSVPMVGYGIVRLTDPVSAELIDSDTFIFIYLVTAEDLNYE